MLKKLTKLVREVVKKTQIFYGQPHSAKGSNKGPKNFFGSKFVSAYV